MAQIPQHIEVFWRSFLDSRLDPAEANARYYESFQIGARDEDADKGAMLILNKHKTATSSLLWEYESSGKSLPNVGDFSVVEDGKRQPVCVVETTWVKVISFAQVDAQFAYEYGEGTRALEAWRQMCWEYYSEVCEAMNREMSKDASLVCERFQLVFP